MHVNGMGFINVESIGMVTINLVVDSCSPAVGSPSGGSEITLIGNGFPLSEDPSLSVTLCGNEVTEFVSVSNQEIKLVSPV